MGFSDPRLGDNLFSNVHWLHRIEASQDRSFSNVSIFLFSLTACQHAGVKEMRKSTIIRSNASVYRFGGRGVDQLVAYTSQRATLRLERNLGTANWPIHVGLTPRFMATCQLGITGNRQPAKFRPILSSCFLPHSDSTCIC